MSDKNTKKLEVEDSTLDAVPDSPPQPTDPQPVDPQPVNPQPVNIDELIPGLVEAVGAEAVASGVIAQLEADCYEMKDKLLRALAETENVRRRALRDRKDAETYSGTKLARDLLAVHDNLDRTLSHVDDAMREQAGSFIEGIELTQRELLNAFGKHKIEKVTPALGEKFDPNRHQAMFEAPVPGAIPGTVIEVMQAGFTIADRLLRPALVGIAKAAPKSEPEKADAKPEENGDE
jgi:molecular chaperone GrpE